MGIRHFTYADGAEFTARARQSKDLHHPWLFPPDSAQAYAAYAGRLIEDRTKAGFLVCEKSPEERTGRGARRRRAAPSRGS
ncbi:GNAT family protein [Streptomyces violaceorubidus]